MKRNSILIFIAALTLLFIGLTIRLKRKENTHLKIHKPVSTRLVTGVQTVIYGDESSNHVSSEIVLCGDNLGMEEPNPRLVGISLENISKTLTQNKNNKPGGHNIFIGRNAALLATRQNYCIIIVDSAVSKSDQLPPYNWYYHLDKNAKIFKTSPRLLNFIVEYENSRRSIKDFYRLQSEIKPLFGTFSSVSIIPIQYNTHSYFSFYSDKAVLSVSNQDSNRIVTVIINKNYVKFINDSTFTYKVTP